MRQISCDNQRHRHGGCGHVEIGLSCFVIRMTDVGGGCRRLLGEGEEWFSLIFCCDYRAALIGEME